MDGRVVGERSDAVPRTATPGHDETTSVFLLEPADVLLRIELEPDPLDQIKLRFEEVDVAFLVLHQALKKIARDVILYAMAVGRGLLVEVARAVLGGEITLDDLFHVLADPDVNECVVLTNQSMDQFDDNGA